MGIEQALYGSRDSAGYRFLARSPGFKEEWLPLAQKLCTNFGELPTGIHCPEALFVQPFGKSEIAVVRVADQGRDDSGRPATLAFHLLVVPRTVYALFGGDPFQLAERFPAVWTAGGDLPTHEAPTEPLPRRTVTQLQEVLQSGDSPTLLGATQALVDGSRFVLERQQPEPKMLRDVWSLLPTRSRCELWPATFAINNALDFHAVVVPAAPTTLFPKHVTEKGAGDYPEGRYELGLQIAVEAGDQAGVDRMLARRTSSDTIRFMLMLMFGMGVIVLIANWLVPAPESRLPTGTTATNPPTAKTNELDLPRVEECPALSVEERALLVTRLHALATRLKAPIADTTSAEELLHAIDSKLGTPNAARATQELKTYGPTERQVRALLYKHEVSSYNDRKLNTVELIERLETKLKLPPGKVP